MFSYNADPTYHEERPAFIKQLVGLPKPILCDDVVRQKTAHGIFGGNLSDWWAPAGQSEMAATPATHNATTSMAE